VSGARQNGSIEVVAIVGSQGALPVARSIVAGLPDDFPAAVVYLQHRAPGRRSFLADLLGYDSRMPVHDLRDAQEVRPGTVYVAPAAGQSTVAADRTWRVSDGRCLADPLLTSLAEVYGPAAAGVVLSGRLRDGAAGLRAIKWAGGRGLIQAPETAEADGMPLAAMATGCYDYVLSPAPLRAALVALVSVPGAAALLGVRAHPVAVAGVS
jgi:two-component system, chemotaxis family, protein-glutamate methylesterase/glutaminase